MDDAFNGAETVLIVTAAILSLLTVALPLYF